MTQNNDWARDCSVYHCTDGDHPSWWVSIAGTKQWKEWYKYASKNMLYDVDECVECGWMSEQHAQDFLNYIESRTKQDTVKEVMEKIFDLPALCSDDSYVINNLLKQLRSEYGIKDE